MSTLSNLFKNVTKTLAATAGNLSACTNNFHSFVKIFNGCIFLDNQNEELKHFGKSFFKAFVEKEESEKLEYEKNDDVITVEESRSRIKCLLLISGLIEFFALCGLMFIPAYITEEKILLFKEHQKCKFAFNNWQN